MAAIAILDLLRRNPNFGVQAFCSRDLFATKLVGASFAITSPVALGVLFGKTQVAYCDAGAEAIGEDYISSIRSASSTILDNISTLRAASSNIFDNDALQYSTKQYNIELKPVLSAFHWKNLTLTSLRSFLLFYLPLLEQRTHTEDDDDDDDDFLENPEERRVNLVVPFKKSVYQILRETSVVTTRRILERLAVHYASQRMAWKLIKDVPRSAMRKAVRGLPTSTYVFRVSRTTLRGHFLAVLASWIVQVGTDIHRFVRSIFTGATEQDDMVDKDKQVKILKKKIHGATVRCTASLVFASVGAGIGASLVRPSAGQWIGCVIGDLAGPFIVGFCFREICLDI